MVKPLEFDGTCDAKFHAYDTLGRKHMEYIKDYGLHDDFPFDLYVERMAHYHGHVSIESFRNAKKKKDTFSETVA